MTAKICKDCNERKPVSDFYKTGKYYVSYCKPCCSVRSKVWRDSNKEYRQAYFREQQLGITKKQYDLQFFLQSGACAICHEEVDYALCADHDHDTGKFRGLLCKKCNFGLGYFKDNVTRLQSAVEYLRSSNECQDS